MPKPSSPTATEPDRPAPAGNDEAPSTGVIATDTASPLIVTSNEPRPAGKPRRAFTVEQKRAILAEADRCTQRGDIAALVRRHAIYSSTLTKWRKALGAGALRGPGRPGKSDDKDKQIKELQRRVVQLESRAKRAESLVDFQKKTLSLLDAAMTLGEH